MMDILEINGLRLRTEVGFSKHEVGKLQEIVVTIQIKISRKASKTDNIEDSINNRTLTKDIISCVENRKYNLIETIGEDIASICVQRHGASWVKVKVLKPNALRFADYSAVIVERCSEDYKWENVHLLLGSNISPKENMIKVIPLLKENFDLIKISRAFQTPPVGYEQQDEFINMAVLVKTKHDPVSVKKILREIESQLGRVRVLGNKNAPRTMDIDIALWNEKIVQFKVTSDNEDIHCVIPDPDVLKQQHAIIPLADLTPEFIHPVEKKSLRTVALELCGINFMSYFPTVYIREENNEKLSLPVMNGELENERIPSTNDRHVALVTGAAKRLGACIATKLHDLGYNVMIHYNTSQDKAISLSRKLNSVRPDSARVVQGNLTANTKETAERIINECLECWGRLDVLVNNASQFHTTEIGKVSEDIWNNFIQTNMSAPFFLSQAAFSSLKTSNGCIVNMVDIHADRPLADHSVYCISKAGLHMCTMSLAKEFSPHVRVNGISPGAILMPQLREPLTSVHLKEDLISKIPLNEIGNRNDIACAVEYLVSSAQYVTGQIIRVDGGRTLNQ